MNHIKTESEIDEFVKSYRKYWDNQNNELQKKDLNINTKVTKNNKEMNNLSKDKQFCNGMFKKVIIKIINIRIVSFIIKICFIEKENKSIDTTKDFFKNRDNENVPENLNKQIISVITETNSNLKSIFVYIIF